MTADIENEYFTWLYRQIGAVSVKNPSRTHWSLAKQLHMKEFVWFIPNDDNRVEDGKDLRFEFVQDCEIASPYPSWMDLGCSMLEMLVSLSRRLSFDADGEPREWFWQMMENLDIAHYSDDRYTKQVFAEVDNILDTVIWRTYAPNGRGGLFPLVVAHEDQRKVELWYQFSAYVLNDI